MRVRLGDDIDDFCVKCKRVMNHSVVSILNDEPAKVRCRTCHSDHDYRHEQAPPKPEPKKKLVAEAAEPAVPAEGEAESGEAAAAAPAEKPAKKTARKAK